MSTVSAIFTTGEQDITIFFFTIILLYFFILRLCKYLHILIDMTKTIKPLLRSSWQPTWGRNSLNGTLLALVYFASKPYIRYINFFCFSNTILALDINETLLTCKCKGDVGWNYDSLSLDLLSDILVYWV